MLSRFWFLVASATPLPKCDISIESKEAFPGVFGDFFHDTLSGQGASQLVCLKHLFVEG